MPSSWLRTGKIAFGISVLLVILCMQDIPAALAQGTGGTTDPAASVVTVFSVTAGYLITGLNFLAWFLFMLLGIVMNPQWIFNLKANGADGTLIGMLREVWTLCRDLVNMAMAAVLIYEAFVMIVKADATKVKEMLPKFVLALIAVNFSWFIPRAIFDASEVFTYTVYQIPSLIGQDRCAVPGPVGQPSRTCEIATRFEFFEKTHLMVSVGSSMYRNNLDQSLGWSCLPRIVCIQFKPYNDVPNISTRMKILNGLVVNYSRLRHLVYITSPVPPTGAPIGATTGLVLANVGAYVIKLGIVLLIHIAIVFPLMAMVAAFFLRIPILWITMALMPLVAIGFIMGDKLGDFNPMEKIWNQFLSAVFLPVKIAFPFALSFVLFNVTSSAVPADPVTLAQMGVSVALFSDVKDIWQMLWMLLTLAILWKFSFEILKKDPIMGQFTEQIQGWGKSLGGIAAKLPLALPILPSATPGGPRTSINQRLGAFNLREINADLRRNTATKVFEDRARIARGESTGPATAPAVPAAATERIRKDTNLNFSNVNTVSNTFTSLRAAGTTDAERIRQIADLLQHARKTAPGAFDGVSNASLLDALAAEHNISAAERKILSAALAAHNGGTSATSTGAIVV